MTLSKILVAGPDPEVAQILRQELAGKAFEISFAGTEDEIVESLSALQPDVMVVELKLPGSAAFRFLDRYKELSPATRILVVAPSADRDDLIHLLQARAFAFFHKPVSAVSLVDMVCEAAECATCEDDIEIVSAVSHWVALRIASRITTVDRVVQFYRELETELPPAEREQMATALREVLMNAVEHGARCDPHSKVTVT
ncbi:MAG: response regulator, partial [Bryobacteraceae bacterium]